MNKFDEVQLFDEVNTIVEDEVCPHCGAKKKVYWQRLSPILVKTLVKFKAAVIQKGENKIHLRDDLELTKSEYTNFQKLRFHGLVAKYKIEGKNIYGYWVLTRRGSDFLKNEITVPVKVKTYRNKVIGYSEARVTVIDVIKSPVYVDNIDIFSMEAEVATNEDILKLKALINTI